MSDPIPKPDAFTANATEKHDHRRPGGTFPPGEQGTTADARTRQHGDLTRSQHGGEHVHHGHRVQRLQRAADGAGQQVAAELAMVDADLSRLPTDPARARDLLAEQLELVWTELIAPH